MCAPTSRASRVKSSWISAIERGLWRRQRGGQGGLCVKRAESRDLAFRSEGMLRRLLLRRV